MRTLLAEGGVVLSDAESCDLAEVRAKVFGARVARDLLSSPSSPVSSQVRAKVLGARGATGDAAEHVEEREFSSEIVQEQEQEQEEEQEQEQQREEEQKVLADESRARTSSRALV